MNPILLEKLLTKPSQGPAGLAISNVHTKIKNTNKDIKWSKVLVIPPGLGKQIARFKELGAVMFENVNNDYPEDSVKEFVTVVQSLNPDIIVAGSRGSMLVTEAFPYISSKSRILLFGPTKLRMFFEARIQNNVTLIVHGVHDQNEKITNVRAYAHSNPNTRLIEVTTQGHSLDIQTSYIRHAVKYVFTK